MSSMPAGLPSNAYVLELENANRVIQTIINTDKAPGDFDWAEQMIWACDRLDDIVRNFLSSYRSENGGKSEGQGEKPAVPDQSEPAGDA